MDRIPWGDGAREAAIAAALDAAVDAIVAGDPESLLRAMRIIEAHPRADELRLLVTSAIEAREAVMAAPSLEARVRHLRMIGVACREHERARTARAARDSRKRRRLLLRPVAVAAGSIALLLPGALALASTAIPGDPLYATKLAVEQVQLALTQDPVSEVALRAEYMDRRIDEARQLDKEGKAREIAAVTPNLRKNAAAVQAGIEKGAAPPGIDTKLRNQVNDMKVLAERAGCGEGDQTPAGCTEINDTVETTTLAMTQLVEGATGKPGSGPLAGRPPAPSPADEVTATPTTAAPDETGTPAAPDAAVAPTTTAPAGTPTDAPGDPTPPPAPSDTPSTDPTATPTPSPWPTPVVPPIGSPHSVPTPGLPQSADPPQSPSPDGTTTDPLTAH